MAKVKEAKSGMAYYESEEFGKELDAALKHFDSFGVGDRGEIEYIARHFYELGLKDGDIN